MKVKLFLALLFAGGALWFLTDNAEAHAFTCASFAGNVCKGDAQVAFDNLGSERRFAFRTANVDGVPTDRATWEATGGFCITAFYQTETVGATPPSAADTVILRMYYDNGATQIREVHNGAPPADGTSYTICFTNDGLSTGSARIGTVRLFVHAIRTSLGTYDGDSDGGGTSHYSARGAIRGNIALTDVSNSLPPTTELVTNPGFETYTTSPGAPDSWTSQGDNLQLTRETVIIRTGSNALRVADTTGTGSSFKGVKQTISVTVGIPHMVEAWCRTDSTINGGRCRVQAVNAADNSVICATNGPSPSSTVPAATYQRLICHWTPTAGITYQIWVGMLRGTVASSVYVDDTSARLATFAYGAAASEIVTLRATDATAFVLGTIENAFFRVIRNDNTIVETTTSQDWNPPITAGVTIDDTFNQGSNIYGIEVLMDGNAVLTGAVWSGAWTATQLPTTYCSAIANNQIRCTGQFYADPTVTFSSDGTTLNNDVITKVGSAGGAAATVFNRGETIYIESYLINARGTQLTRDMTLDVLNVGSASEDSQSLTPTAGKYSTTYLAAATDTAENDAVGSGKRWRATNTDKTVTSDTNFFLSSLYYVDSHIQDNNPVNKDDFPTQDDTEIFSYLFGSPVKGWCHAKGVRLDTEIDTSGTAITQSYLKPDLTVFQTRTTDTGADGWTENTVGYEMVATAPAGIWAAVCDVTFSGNTGIDTESFNVVSSFTGDLENEFTAPNIVTLNTEVTIYVRTTRDAACFVPDEAPLITITHVDDSLNPPETITDEDDTMYNVVDDTQTVNGCLYYYTYTFAEDDTDYNINVRALYMGANLADSITIQVTNQVPRLRLLHPESVTPGTFALYLRIEFVETPLDSDTLPEIRFDAVAAGVWTQIIDYTDMTNTATGVYVYNADLDSGSYQVEIKAVIMGALYRVDDSLTVGNEGLEIMDSQVAASLNIGIEVFAMFAILVLLIIWAEYTKSYVIYLAAILACWSATIGLWSELADFRFIFPLASLVLMYRGFILWNDEEKQERLKDES